MSIALTCDCGARFEVADLFAGQPVSCPDCLATVAAPARPAGPPPVSPLALYSLVVAVLGALTLVGSIAAVVLAGVALVRIGRSAGRFGGAGYAVAAIGVAVAGAALTLGLLFRPAALALPAWFPAPTVAGRIDTALPERVGSRDGVCMLTRPAGWGQLRDNQGIDPMIAHLQEKRDLLLCSPHGDAYLDVRRDPGAHLGPEKYSEELLVELQVPPPELLEEDGNPLGPIRQTIIVVPRGGGEKLQAGNGYVGFERMVDLHCGSRVWRWVIRHYRKSPPRAGDTVAYVVRACVPLDRFPAVEAELRRALDSVRFSR